MVLVMQQKIGASSPDLMTPTLQRGLLEDLDGSRLLCHVFYAYTRFILSVIISMHHLENLYCLLL